MPGTRLSQQEKRLLQWWETASSFPYPILKGIVIQAREPGSGLRGIERLDLEFKAPVSVIIGKNGSGKSTILALAALAYHSPDGFFARGAWRKRGAKRSYYTFRNFFFRGPNDPDITGIQIKWRYLSSASPPEETHIGLTKRSEKWMHYDRRPERPVHFVGITRALPAIEQSTLRRFFGHRARGQQVMSLNSVSLGYLNYIMNRRYQNAETLRSSKNVVKHEIRKLTLPEYSYSSFNMGSGEDILIELLSLIQDSPDGSLIVIEEIEFGLHPEALEKLAEVIIKIALARKIQFVISSHSQFFVDNLPRESRVLIEREGGNLHIVYGPATRYALGKISTARSPEIKIFCEDTVAAEIIASSLSAEHRRRALIVPIGDKKATFDAAYFHNKTHTRERCLVVFDGDVSTNEINGWCRNGQTSIKYVSLPFGTAPERWLLDTLRQPEGKSHLAAYLRASEPEVNSLIDSMDSRTDPHDVFEPICERYGHRLESVIARLAEIAVRVRPDDVRHIPEAVAHLLDGTDKPNSLNSACE